MPRRRLARTLVVTTFLSSPWLVQVCLPLMNYLSYTQTWLLNPDKNPVLRGIIKALFYNHFGAGVNERQTSRTISDMKRMGCHGVILGYSRETMAGHSKSALDSCNDLSLKQIEEWKLGHLLTITIAGPNDFVALKFTGAGKTVCEALCAGQSPPPEFQSAMKDVIQVAMTKGARIVIDAEQQCYRNTIDSWTIDLMRKYNTAGNTTSNGPPIYNTMQAYLKSLPDTLTKHLKLAQAEGFTFGFKLVRRAYISSDIRSKIHDTKQDTDDAYDMLASAMIRQSMPGFEGPWPCVRFVIAGHNELSVRRALATQEEEVIAGRATRALEFGQIQGMADEITCSLGQMRRQEGDEKSEGEHELSLDKAPKVYKALCWGSVQELMQNLIRRAIEDKAAVERIKEWRYGLLREVVRRCRSVLWLGSGGQVAKSLK